MWNQELIIYGVPNKWNYIDGCMITAVLALYEMTGEERYFNFAKDFVDAYVQEDGEIRTYDTKEHNLDNINAARNLFVLYEKTGDEKYKKAIGKVRSQLDSMPRTKEGNFWHKQIYPWQVWLDGMYMAQPFYMQYETVFNGMEKCYDSIHMFENVVRIMKDPKTGLYYHGYDESREMYWADPKTGLSRNFWLRAIGWFAMALVDTASVISETLYYDSDSDYFSESWGADNSYGTTSHTTYHPSSRGISIPVEHLMMDKDKMVEHFKARQAKRVREELEAERLRRVAALEQELYKLKS